MDVQASLPYVPRRRMLQLNKSNYKPPRLITNPWVQNPSVGNPLASTTIIEIVSPCIDPFSVKAGQRLVAGAITYEYTGTLSWEIEPFSVAPSLCAS